MAQGVKLSPKKISLWKIIAWIVIPLVVAVLGCVGTISGEWIGAMTSWLLSGRQTNTPIATDVPVVELPVTGSSSSTNTPVPSPTPFVPGQDWSSGCISNEWIIYPAFETVADGAGCYQQPIWNYISTRDGKLYILAQHQSMIKAEEFGLFTRIPNESNVRLNIDLDLVENGEVWVGAFSRPDVYSDGVLIVVPPGEVRDHIFAIRTMPNQKRYSLTGTYSDPQGVFSVGFDLHSGSITPVVEEIPRDVFAFSSSQRWLFVGYRAKLDMEIGWANIEASIQDLVITSP